MTDSTHYVGDGCQPEHKWPAPTKPPSKVRHSWRCSRQAPVVETMKPHPTTGQMMIVSQCQGCGCDDMDSRLIDTLLPEPPDAA